MHLLFLFLSTDSPSALLKNFTAMSKEPEEEEDTSDNMKSYGLEFDASYFRANKEVSKNNPNVFIMWA